MNNIVVTGMHRSGTTHIGMIIESASEVCVIHEPFNYLLGDTRVPCWYPSLKVLEKKELSKLLKDIFEPKFIKKRTIKSLKGESVFRTIGRIILGGTFEKSVRRAKRCRSISGDTKLLIKDPFAFRLSPYFSNVGITTVVTIKHPLSNLSSVKKQGWSIDKDSFSNDIFDKSYVDFAFLLKGIFTDDEIDFLWLWYFLHIEILNSKFSGYIIWHDNFCRAPLNLLSTDLISELNVEPIKLERQIKNTMLADKVINRKKGLHQMIRNSNYLTDKWTSEYTHKQIEVIDKYFGEIIDRCRGKSII